MIHTSFFSIPNKIVLFGKNDCISALYGGHHVTSLCVYVVVDLDQGV